MALIAIGFYSRLNIHLAKHLVGDGETLSGHDFRPVHLWPDIVDHLEMMTIGWLAY